jgi:Ca2+-binding RTX toxin-like protein
MSSTQVQRAPRRALARAAALVAALALVPVAAAVAADGHAATAHPACEPSEPGVQCSAGNGRRTVGGGEKVPHTGWPAITGIFWKVNDSGGHTRTGTAANDELLGHHGNDHLSGGAGDDVLWGDWDPSGNRSTQRDVLSGGAGNDWIYPSHGATVVRAGSGNDHVWAFYGHGSIDCGPGRDTVRVRMNGAFKLHGCEVVQHFCAYGSDGHGGCRQPGHSRAVAARRR